MHLAWFTYSEYRPFVLATIDFAANLSSLHRLSPALDPGRSFSYSALTALPEGIFQSLTGLERL